MNILVTLQIMKKMGNVIQKLKEQKNLERKEKNFEIKENKILPLAKAEIFLGKEALREILNEDDKKNNDNDSKSNSIGIEESYFDITNKSDLSSLEDNKSKASEIKIEEENWDIVIYIKQRFDLKY